MFKCARPNCVRSGINRCSICLREAYCGGDCQKLDWKSHKLICKSIKKLSFQLQPYHEVVQVLDLMKEEIPDYNPLSIRAIGHMISYAEHQFGDRVPGRAYRERINNEQIDNWKVEIDILCSIYHEAVAFYESDESLSVTIIHNLQFPYYEKMLDLLRPWSTCPEFNSTTCADSLETNEINFVLKLLSRTEWKLALIHQRRRQFDLAEIHCQLALSYARQYEGTEEEKADILSVALSMNYSLQADQGRFDKALIYAEEDYNLVVVTYDPLHPYVQASADTLIRCLIQKGDLYDAERFVQVTLDSLKDPKNGLDQETDAVATAYINLAHIIHQQKGDRDLVKAETLARESLRIKERIHNNDEKVGREISVLACILQAQGKLGDETEQLQKRGLAIDIKKGGPDGSNTGITYSNLAGFYHEVAETQNNSLAMKKYLRLSIFNYKEALRICTMTFGKDHFRTIQISSHLSIASKNLSKA